MLTKLLAPQTQRNIISNLRLKFLFGLFSLIWMQFSFAQSSNPSVNLGNNQIICSGSNTTTVTAATNNLGALTVSSYAWTIEGVSVGTSSSISITVNASLSSNNPQEVICLATLSNSTFISDTILVYTINPGVIAGDQFSCTSPYDPNAFTSSNGGTTSLSGASIDYQWQSSTNGTIWTNISGQTNATFNPNSISTSTYFRRAIICTVGSVSQTCYSNSLFVQVLTAPTISAAANTIEALAASPRIQSKPSVESKGVRKDKRPICRASPRLRAASHK